MITNEQSLAIFGSTGSVGRQALEVASHLGWRVEALTAFCRVKEAEEQIRRYRPAVFAMADEEAARDLRVRVADTGVRLYGGASGLEELAGTVPSDILLNAIVGMAGLRPTLARIRTGKTLALANKESLVVGGSLVMAEAAAHGVEVLPVDSEHCAVWQCLRCGQPNEVDRVILTASGGPFFGYSREQLETVTVEETLAHPTWRMGGKITVDCATMMNKGFEVIEAMHLFGLKPEQVEVVIHRESIVHSMVAYRDGAVAAQLSVPDMRLCIQYALTGASRPAGLTPALDLTKIGSLTFYKPDHEAFPLLRLACRAGACGGTAAASMNAANEAAVEAFLSGKIPFTAIPDTVLAVTEEQIRGGAGDVPVTLEHIEEADRAAREAAAGRLARLI